MAIDLQDTFWAPRHCFLPPIVELDIAAELMAKAADAALAGDPDQARKQLRAANMPVVHAFAVRIMGKFDQDIHRRRMIERPAVVAKAARRPSPLVEAAIFARDGWRCRYCGVRVLSREARGVLCKLFPDAVCWSGPDKDRHAAFLALSAVADHVLPHALGGNSEPENLVTTCQGCNYGKGDLLLEELGLIDPRTRAPIVDAWDGLERVLPLAKLSSPAMPTRREDRAPTAGKSSRPMSEDAWFAELDRIEAGLSKRLLTFLTGCEGLGISWGLNKVLIFRLRVDDITLQVCGVESDGRTHIPWLIGDQKEPFRHFAERIAAAVPGSWAREAPKQWIVEKFDRQKLDIRELLVAGPVLHDALAALATEIHARRSPQPNGTEAAHSSDHSDQ